ncbi:MAG: TetR/AcrR family transcriptional regulator [Spirochaetia bacterium]|jgi:AcrR family transcriptional regulator|nr:TetR/AcrR family transcriptional regulator [Spirochaetia bacterium]
MAEIEKEEAIYQAAKDLFHESGYKKTTMEKIAKRAGISNGLISYYYKKQDFIERLFREFMEKINDVITRDVGKLLENLFQRYILLGKIESMILYNTSPESIKLFKELADNNLVPVTLHLAFRKLLRTVLEEFNCGISEEYFNFYCEIELAAKVRINSDIHSGKVFLGETTVYDFLSGLVLKLAGIPDDIINKNIRKANKLYKKVDFSGIDLFS